MFCYVYGIAFEIFSLEDKEQRWEKKGALIEKKKTRLQLLSSLALSTRAALGPPPLPPARTVR